MQIKRFEARTMTEALKLVKKISEEYPITLVNSLNPHRIEGQKSAAYEICDVLGDAPDVLAIPVGNAGNVSSYSLGFAGYLLLRRVLRH
mgnify:CR=1 FL=1